MVTDGYAFSTIPWRRSARVSIAVVSSMVLPATGRLPSSGIVNRPSGPTGPSWFNSPLYGKVTDNSSPAPIRYSGTAPGAAIGAIGRGGGAATATPAAMLPTATSTKNADAPRCGRRAPVTAAIGSRSDISFPNVRITPR